MTSAQKGLLFGLAATCVGGIYTVFAQRAPSMGLDPLDLLAFRYGVASLVLAPFIWRFGPGSNFAGLGLWRAIVLSIFGGVGFVLFFFSGFQFAPLAHGAVLPPGSSAISGALLALLFYGERIGPRRIAALAAIVFGLVLVSGPAFLEMREGTWIGDLLFIIAGFNWATFLLLLARWRVGALEATTITSVLTAIVFLPMYAITGGYRNLGGVAQADIVVQVVVQGALAGVGALYLFARSASYLSTAVSTALPGLMPVMALLFGFAFFAIVPAPSAMFGAVCVIFGQAVGAGVLRRKKAA